MAIGMSIRQACTLFDVGTMSGLTDSQLLERFLHRNDEAAELAFAALVERHGPMVMRVCGRVLADANDVHDAFQATFLVLVTKAGSVRRRESLASWLHGVALRVARCSRGAASRRRRHELRRAKQWGTAYEAAPSDGSGSLIRDEFNRLPARYRTPILLCDLEDLTHEEAARQLDWPVGTVKSRLARGRARLRERLTRRGLGYSAVVAFRPPALTSSLMDQTARIATRVASGGPAAGMVSASIQTLLQGVRRMMFKDMIRTGSFIVLTVGLLAVGAVLARGPNEPAPKPVVAPNSERQIVNKIRFLDMDGLDWKDSLKTKLKLVKTQGEVKVWTVDATAIEDLNKRAKATIMAPNVTAFEGNNAHISYTKTHKYIASMRVEYNKDGAAGFIPSIKDIETGTKFEITSRKMDQGILSRIRVDDRRLRSLESVPVPAVVNNVKVAALIQVPDTARIQQEGEWLIPNDGLLIISLGAHHDPAASTVTGISWLDDMMAELELQGRTPAFIQQLLVHPLPPAIKNLPAELVESVKQLFQVHEKRYWSAPIVERLIVINARSLEEIELRNSPPVVAQSTADVKKTASRP